MKRYFITRGKRIIDMEKIAHARAEETNRRSSLFRVYIWCYPGKGHFVPSIELQGKEALKFWDMYETRAEEINEEMRLKSPFPLYGSY
jgi:hypothetical protein